MLRSPGDPQHVISIPSQTLLLRRRNPCPILRLRRRIRRHPLDVTNHDALDHHPRRRPRHGHPVRRAGDGGRPRPDGRPRADAADLGRDDRAWCRAGRVQRGAVPVPARARAVAHRAALRRRCRRGRGAVRRRDAGAGARRRADANWGVSLARSGDATLRGLGHTPSGHRLHLRGRRHGGATLRGCVRAVARRLLPPHLPEPL